MGLQFITAGGLMLMCDLCYIPGRRQDHVRDWRPQVIAARIYKAENKIPDAPNEIDLAIADIETTVAKAEEREDTLRRG